MAPRKSPKKGGNKKSSNVDIVADPVVDKVKTSKKKKNKRSSVAPGRSVASRDASPVVSAPKKTSKESLIKNLKFKKSKQPNPVADNQSAPWFSSLVQDVASILNKEGSPLKRKRVDGPVDSNKKGRTDGSDVSSLEAESLGDSDFDLGDEEYYFDEFDDVLDDGNATNNANSGGFLNSQKRELLDFMDGFVTSYESNRSKVTKGGKAKKASVSPRKGSRSPINSTAFRSDEVFTYPTPSGSQISNSGPSVSQPAKDRNFIRSLKQDRQANKVAENFLQLAGLSQSESSDLFRKANAKKSGEHRKPSDSAPIEIRWPQEMLERPRGLEVGYNDLSVAEFLSGNLAIVENGLPDSKYYATIRSQLGYFRTLCEDISDYNWPLVREAHKAVLLSIEKGALDPNDLQTMEIKRKSALERAYRHQGPIPVSNSDFMAASTSKANFNNKPSNQSASSSAPGLLLRICKHFNEGKCSFDKEHQKGAYLWTHICGFCWHRLKQKRNHQENECEAKRKDVSKGPKNEKGGN